MLPITNASGALTVTIRESRPEEKDTTWQRISGIFQRCFSAVQNIFVTNWRTLVSNANYFSPIDTFNTRYHVVENGHLSRCLLLPHRHDPKGPFFISSEHAIATQRLQMIWPEITQNDLFIECDQKHHDTYKKLFSSIFSEKKVEEYKEFVEHIVRTHLSEYQSRDIDPRTFCETYVMKALCKLLTNNDYSEGFHIALRVIIEDVQEQLLHIRDGDLENETIGSYIDNSFEHLHLSESGLSKKIRNSNLSEKEKKATILCLFIEGLDHTAALLEKVIQHLAENPRTNARTNSEELFINALRSYSVAMERFPNGPITVDVKDVNKEEKSFPFDSGRDDRLLICPLSKNTRSDSPSYLPLLPNYPFGFGPHVCRGWQLAKLIVCTMAKELSKKQLTITDSDNQGSALLRIESKAGKLRKRTY